MSWAFFSHPNKITPTATVGVIHIINEIVFDLVFDKT